MSNQSNNALHEVDVSTGITMYRLVNPDLLRTLMQRTGTGAGVTVRELAAAAGVPHGTIGNLLTGEQDGVPYEKACLIAQRIGVDLLVLFVPVERSASPTGAITEAMSA